MHHNSDWSGNRLKYKTVGLICSGGNLSVEKLRKALDFAAKESEFL